jgi:hypothetical protein
VQNKRYTVHTLQIWIHAGVYPVLRCGAGMTGQSNIGRFTNHESRATGKQNVWHRRKFIRRTSGGFQKPSRSRYKGVDWAKDMKRWRARILVNGKRIYLGSFENEIDAAKAYDEAAKRYHGDFAALNFDK